MFYLSGGRFRALVQVLQSLKQNKTAVTALTLLYSANNFAMKGKRKTLNASDVLSAMEEMEFQRFVTPLKEALEAYRREQKGKKEASEQKKKDKDKKTDSEEQDKSRDEDNDEDEERLEEEEQNEEEEVDN
ncbi:DNA polymerase epsilon subunit 3 isoform X2 [Kogia breviceps]|uniref:DNA polymerase epsilon subunit 3 isoform X2 n=1 Tax=Kogia breviceps TaxID=27615 RepID=UPI0034D30636